MTNNKQTPIEKAIDLIDGFLTELDDIAENNKQQTAVDKIVTLLNKKGFSPVLTEEEIKFFKEMEKEQIMDACWAGGDDGERYYSETYGGNK